MKAVVGRTESHYQRVNETPGVIHGWEDGLRTGAADGTFEWWYFDGHLDDGSVLTVEFHTKPPYVSPKAPLTPFVLVTLTRADGSRLDQTYRGKPTEFSAATDACDVRIGPNVFRIVDRHYEIHIEIDDFTVDLTLTPQVPPWRPESGFLYFGADEEHYIAWLPVVARGAVEATLTVDGRTAALSGLGYHDHNWGNIAPRKVLDHWYWGRALLGDYTIVSLTFVVNDNYGGTTVPVLMIARGSEIVAARVGDGVAVVTADQSIHPDSGVPVDRLVQYSIGESGTTYTVTFRYNADIFRIDFGQHGAYHRFLGDVDLIETRDGQAEALSAKTVWELLYFGARSHPPVDVTAVSDDRPRIIGHQA